MCSSTTREICCLCIYQNDQTKITAPKQTEIFDTDLLLLYEPAKHHYVLVIDLLKFICEIKGCKYRPIARLCRNCFHISWSDETHEQHIQCCKDHEPALVVMPSAEKGTNRYEFKNL